MHTTTGSRNVYNQFIRLSLPETTTFMYKLDKVCTEKGKKSLFYQHAYYGRFNNFLQLFYKVSLPGTITFDHVQIRPVLY